MLQLAGILYGIAIIANMKFLSALILPLLSLSAGLAVADPAWGFEDATLFVTDKNAGVGGGIKEKYARLRSYLRLHAVAHAQPGFLLSRHSLTLSH